MYAMTTRETRTNHLLIFFDLFFGKSPLNECEFMVIWDCITFSLNIGLHTARVSRNFNEILKQKRRSREQGSMQGRINCPWEESTSPVGALEVDSIIYPPEAEFPNKMLEKLFLIRRIVSSADSFIKSNVKLKS